LLAWSDSISLHVLVLGAPVMRSRSDPLQLRDFASVAFWLLVKIGAGFLIGAALFETVGLVVGLITWVTGG
jgi:hypothetical protein